MKNVRFAFLIALLLSLVALLIVALFTDPATVTLNIMYGITGFCAGFLYATHLYMGLRVTPRRRGPRGRQGPPGERGPSG